MSHIFRHYRWRQTTQTKPSRHIGINSKLLIQNANRNQGHSIECAERSGGASRLSAFEVCTQTLTWIAMTRTGITKTTHRKQSPGSWRCVDAGISQTLGLVTEYAEHAKRVLWVSALPEVPPRIPSQKDLSGLIGQF